MDQKASKAAWIGKIAAATVIAVILLGGVGLFGIFSQHRETDRAVQRYESRRELEGLLLDALVSFKIEVQEWKNTLIRSRSPEELAKWRQTFVDQSDKTKLAIEKVAVFEKLLNEEQARVTKLKDQHAANVADYLKALDENYQTDNPATIFVVDGIVRGKDRELARELDEFADLVGAREVSEIATNLNEAKTRYENYKLVTIVILLLAASLAVTLAFMAVFQARKSSPSSDA